MPDNEAPFAKLMTDARAETSSRIDGWTVRQTDRGQRPPYDFCLHIERAPHIIHTLTHMH